MGKVSNSILVLLLVVFQFQIWFGENSVKANQELEKTLVSQQANNLELETRNRGLEVEILDLKNGLEAVEERARSELGMIREDETFYLIVD